MDGGRAEELLVVPLALAGLAFLLDNAQNNRARRQEDQRAAQQQQAARAASREEQQAALDASREKALGDY
jgi:hypothetical protein